MVGAVVQSALGGDRLFEWLRLGLRLELRLGSRSGKASMRLVNTVTVLMMPEPAGASNEKVGCHSPLREASCVP